VLRVLTSTEPLTERTDAYTRLTGRACQGCCWGCTQLARLPKSDPSTPPWTTQPDALALTIMTRYLHMAARAPESAGVSEGCAESPSGHRQSTECTQVWAISGPISTVKGGHLR
jgi:hypothetical protein